MKFTKYLLIALLSIVLASCEKEPYTEYTFGIRDDKNIEEYEELAFNEGIYIPGVDFPDFYSVGAVVAGENEGSGTLINSEWVVTAAHVLSDDNQTIPEASTVEFFIGNDFLDPDFSYTASEIFIHPGWFTNPETGDKEGVDIAIIHLSAPVTNITPIPAYFGENDVINNKIFVSGYGDYSEFLGVDIYTNRHAFENIMDRKLTNITPSNSYTGSDIYKGGIIACDFDNPDNTTNSLGIDAFYAVDDEFLSSGDSESQPLGLEGTTVPGDSGGAALMYLDGGWKIIGIVSYGNTDSEYGDIAVFTRISSHKNWIESVTGLVL